MTVQPVGTDVADDSVAEDTADPQGGRQIAGRTPWQLARARLRHDTVSMIAFWVLAVLVALAVVSPFLVAFGVLDPYTGHQDLVGGVGSVPTGAFGGASAHHLLGVTPQSGTDVLSRLFYGISVSLLISVSATVVSIVLGTIAGIVAGYLGGWPDAGIGRFMDLVLAFPQLLMFLALSNSLEQRITAFGVPAGNATTITYLITVLGFFGWPYFARIIRGQVLSLREREFVEAARSLGSSRARIYFKELLPNLWAPLLIYFTLNVPVNISTEAALSFLGVGVQAPTPTLGNVLTDSSNYNGTDNTYFWVPAIIIFALVLAFNLLGDGLRDALDPKSNR